MLKLVALVIPLGLDTFAISSALGIAGINAKDRLRVSLLFMAFEAGMPLIGLALGEPWVGCLANSLKSAQSFY